MSKIQFVLFFLLLNCPLCSLFAQGNLSDLDRDLKEMMTIFEGEFNNFQQVWKEKEDKVPDSLIHEHIHSIFKKVDMPKLGEHTFFVKQYMDGDTSKIYRQRVYNFHVNATEDAIQLDIYSFKTPEEEKKYHQANWIPSILKDLTTNDFRSLPGCEVFWKKEGEAFIGYMKDKACHFTSRRSGKEIYIIDSLQLTKDEIWIRDEAFDENGNYVFGHKGGIHHKLKRCEEFTGWIAVQKENDAEQYYLMRNIILHNQGQKVPLVDQDGSVTKYSVEISEVIYRGGIEVLKLAVYEEGKEKSICYVWSDPKVERIGINMRSVTAGFTRVK